MANEMNKFSIHKISYMECENHHVVGLIVAIEGEIPILSGKCSKCGSKNLTMKTITIDLNDIIGITPLNIADLFKLPEEGPIPTDPLKILEIIKVGIKIKDIARIKPNFKNGEAKLELIIDL